MGRSRRFKNEDKIYDNEAGLLALLEKVLLANGFEVYKEVSTPNGYCDIVATYNTPDKQIRWAIEGKMVAGDAVITQAYNNRKYFDYVSVCTPKKPNWIYEQFLKREGIGCITLRQSALYPEEALKGELYMFEGDKNEVLPDIFTPYYDALNHILLPVINPNPKTDKVVLHELHKLEQAGKSAGERLTKYKFTVIKIQEYLKGKGWVELKTLLTDMKEDLYWSNPRSSLCNVFQNWETNKFEYKSEGRVSSVRNKE